MNKHMALLVALLGMATTLVAQGTDGGLRPKEKNELSAAGEALMDEGMALARKGKFDKALVKLYKAMETDSTHPGLLSNLGVVEMQNGDLPHAEQHLELAWQRDTTHITIAVNLGLVYYESKKFESCIRVFTYVLDNTRDLGTIGSVYFNRGMAYAQLGKCAEARSDYEATRNTFSDLRSVDAQLRKLKEMVEGCKQK